MATIYDVNSGKLIELAAAELKKIKEVDMPEWAKFVKTGASKERHPVNKDWWYVRAASILRKIYLNGPIGVNKLRIMYGGRKNMGVRPERVYKGGGKIIRVILQQLEKLNFIKLDKKAVRKGRLISSKGKSFLDKLAKSVK